eukprot:765187-Hanusia_phi.AAC.4
MAGSMRSLLGHACDFPGGRRGGRRKRGEEGGEWWEEGGHGEYECVSEGQRGGRRREERQKGDGSQDGGGGGTERAEGTERTLRTATVYFAEPAEAQHG